MNAKELKEVVAKHGKWLRGEDGGARADLSGANLNGANLRYADLSYSDLSYANLSYADLSYSDLRYANLRGANLWGCCGNLVNVKSVLLDTYPVAYTADVMQIGCQRHEIAKWWAFSGEEIARMDSKALEWWARFKPLLMQIIELSPAEPTGYVEKPE